MDAHTEATSANTGRLTFQQQWIWEFTRKYQHNFLMKYAMRIVGPLQIPTLRSCLSTLVSRNDSLRTTFPVVDGALFRKVCAPAEFALTVTDVSGEVSVEASRSIARRGIEAFFREFFDLEGGPLFQARLWKTAADEHVLAVAAHHIIFDATSAAIVFREMWKLYGELAQGGEPERAPQPVQYSDYVRWQNASDTAWEEKHAPYWREMLRGAAPVRLPRDADVAPVPSHTMLPLKVVFGPQVSAGLIEFARRQRVMVAMVVLTLYAAVVGRWSNRRDVLIPYNISGRVSPSHRSVVGMIAQPLPIRVALVESDTFVAAVQRTCRAFYAANTHLDCGRIAAAAPELTEGTPMQWSSLAPRELTGVPSSREASAALEGLVIESFPFTMERSTNFKIDLDVVLAFIHSDSGISGYGSYRADLFRPETAQRFAKRLCAVAEEVVRSPECEMRSILCGSGV
jgi:Condensation domain